MKVDKWRFPDNEISNTRPPWRFRDDEMDVGPRALFHFEFPTMLKWAMAPAHFHYDKMGDGPRTLSLCRNGRLAPAHFSILEISR